MKRIARALLASLCLVTACLAISGALYQMIGRWRDARRFPNRGHLVQAGAIRMNIDCSGQGSPTVILESGSGGPSIDWLMVQPEVEKFARVCSYDRAGYGWSDSGAGPRSSLQIARELKQLLRSAEEKGPYVLVGHSMGGYDIRVYTGQYPKDVVGMVLVDGSHEDQDLRAPEPIRKWQQAHRKHPGWEKLKYFLQLHLGWARLTADRDVPEFWPKAFREEEEFLTLPTKHQFAVIDEDQVFPTLSGAEVRTAGNLGDRPLIVLTATRQDDIPPEIPPKDAQAEEDLWVHQLQPELARLSTHGKQIVVDSSHEIPTEHPEVVISAIHEVWLAAQVYRSGAYQGQLVRADLMAFMHNQDVDLSDSVPRPLALKRLDGIDLLRGLSIFFVLMNHINIRLLGADVRYTEFLPAQLVHVLVWNAQLGVQMFFAISGFLITSITIRRWGSLPQVSLRGFYLFRFARIAPLLFLLLAVLCTLHFADVHHYVVTPETGGLGRALLAALTLHINELEIHRGYLPGNWDILWSLSIEEMFYLFSPLACLLLAGERFFGRSIVFPALLLVFVILGPFGRTLFAHGNEIAEDYSYLGGMEGISWGCLTALAVSSRRFSRRAIWGLGIAGTMVVSTSLIFSWQAYTGWLGKTGLNFTLLGVGTCMFIAATTQTEWRSPRLFGPLVRMGRYSYEIYLTHMFVVFTLFDLFLHAGKPMRGVPILFVFAILFAAVLGAGVANLYSEPANRFLRNKAGNPVGSGASIALTPAEEATARSLKS